MRNHFATAAHLAFIEGRRVDRDQQICAHLDQLSGRIVRIESLLPESLVVPEIFANGHTQISIFKLEKAPFARRFEVTRIVEHIVFRQQGLVGETEQRPVANNRGRVVQFAARRLIARPDGADDRR